MPNLSHHGQSTDFQSGDEIVLFRDRERPFLAFFRSGVQLRAPGNDGRLMAGMDGGFLDRETLDPGSAACKAFARFLEFFVGKPLEPLPTEAAHDRYHRVFENPCAVWRIR